MIRALSILAAIAALAVSAAPALAATSKKPPHGTARVGGKMHLEDISLGLTSPKPKPKPLAEEVTEELAFSGDAYVNEMG